MYVYLLLLYYSLDTGPPKALPTSTRGWNNAYHKIPSSIKVTRFSPLVTRFYKTTSYIRVRHFRPLVTCSRISCSA